MGGGGERGRSYTYRYTVATRMTSALRWAAMRAISIFHNNCEGQSHQTVSTDHTLSRERRAEADLNQSLSAYQPNALPLGQTGSLYYQRLHWPLIYDSGADCKDSTVQRNLCRLSEALQTTILCYFELLIGPRLKKY